VHQRSPKPKPQTPPPKRNRSAVLVRHHQPQKLLSRRRLPLRTLTSREINPAHQQKKQKRGENESVPELQQKLMRRLPRMQTQKCRRNPKANRQKRDKHRQRHRQNQKINNPREQPQKKRRPRREQRLRPASVDHLTSQIPSTQHSGPRLFARRQSPRPSNSPTESAHPRHASTSPVARRV
jgi:hypothetical protein